MTIRVRKVSRVRWTRGTVTVNGRTFKRLSRTQLARAIRLTGLPSGRIVLAVTVRASDGRSVKITRTYTRCTAALPPRPQPAPAPAPSPTATPSPTPTVTPTPSPTPVPPAQAPPGSYTVSGTGLAARFFVSPDGTEVQDVAITVDLTCTPGGGFRTIIPIGEIAIAGDGSFSATPTQNGVISGTALALTYTINGRFTGSTATGTVRADATYNDGVQRTCTSNTILWNATRDNQGAQGTPPSPGSYTLTGTGLGARFFVSPDGKELQDVAATVDLVCMPAGSMRHDVLFDEITIGADGSFTATANQTGIVSAATAAYAYTFKGHFHGTDSFGTPRLAGILRITITYNDGVARTCTSNDVSWRATRDNQGAQGTPPSPGSYTLTGTGLGARFFVSPDGKELQDVAATVDLTCNPAGSMRQDVLFDEITIGADGTFIATTDQTGVVSGSTATWAYVFKGHFHGTDTAGTPRLAGILRVTVTYNDGIARTCTSNDVAWRATRDNQGAQGTPPSPGSYTLTGTGLGARFFVSPDGEELQDVAATVDLVCMPAGSTRQVVLFDEITIQPDGSFTATANQTGIVSASTATWAYVFKGHFHGTDTAGTPRLAGILRVTVTYNDGIARTCTSNDVAWRATRDNQGAQGTPPSPGSYTLTGTGLGASFRVSAAGTAIQDVAVTIDTTCMPAGTVRVQIPITEIPIAPDGTFATTSVQNGQVGGNPATFTHTFRGHFHGTSNTGVARLAGIVRTNVSYVDGVQRTCTSNDTAWHATRSGP